MVIRPLGSTWLILRQRDHACLSADLARAMSLPPFDELGQREKLLGAIAHHDDGWIAWDADPKIDPKLGRPRGFNEMERRDSLPIWRTSIELAAECGPLAGATVAAHFLALSRFGGEGVITETWARWADGQRQGWLDKWFAEDPVHNLAAADAALGWLHFFDSFSLNLCRGHASQPFPLKKPDGHEIVMDWIDDTRAHVEPWPFECDTLALSMRGYHFPTARPASKEIVWQLMSSSA